MIVDVLMALGIVGGVGLLAGVLLALASHFFYVPEDEKAKKLREALPGINCGACGYKGCDDYAAAMSEGHAEPNLCVPGGADTAEALADVLGVVASETKGLVAFVHCNGNCEATSKKAEYKGVKSCRAAAAVYGGPDACLYGCIGYGDCAMSCPTNAICIKDGIAHVDSRLCVGCGLCASVCPKNIISLIPQTASVAVMCNNHDKGAEARKVCKNACIACRKCEKSCPEGAIAVVDNLARIDYDKCNGDAVCVSVCPTQCIKELNFSESKKKDEL